MQAIPTLLLAVISKSQVLDVEKLATIVVHVNCLHMLPCVLSLSSQKHCFEVTVILFHCVTKLLKSFKRNFLFVCDGLLYISNSMFLNK
jgi:hypothetical protein